MKTRTILSVLGILLCTVGLALYLYGPKRYVEHESENLGSWAGRVSSESSEVVVGYNLQSIGYFASNVKLDVEVDVSDNRVLLYVLNSSQFQFWQQTQILSNNVMWVSILDELTFSVGIDEPDSFYFIAENPSSTSADVHISLHLIGDFLRFDYTLLPLHIVLFVTGTIICLTLRKEISVRLDEFLKSWSLPVHRHLGRTKLDTERVNLRYDSMARFKSFSKYFVLVLLGVIAVNFAYKALPVVSMIGSSNPILSGYSALFIDLLFRNSISKVFLVFPLLAGIPVLFLIINPRLSDLSDLVNSASGLVKRRSTKQWQISKHMYERVVKAVFSKGFVLLVALLLAPVILIFYSPLGEMQIVETAHFTFSAFVLGTWASYTVCSGFHEICTERGIGQYAADRFMKLELVSTTVETSLAFAYVAGLLLFTISDFWISTVNSIVTEPVALLNHLPFFVDISGAQFLVVLGMVSIVVSFGLIGSFFFLLFPFLHRMGRKGAVAAGLVFGLTYMTEHSITWAFQGTVNPIIQPVGLVVPLAAAIVAWVAQDKYKKMIQKRLA